MSDGSSFHLARDRQRFREAAREVPGEPDFVYTFENFFHPFVGQLIERLNQQSLTGLLDPVFHESLATPFFDAFYTASGEPGVTVESSPLEIDVAPGGPYANYNWELLFHLPVAVAVQLSNNQRFAEAQRWFHFVFDPTNKDASVAAPARFWRFLRFRRLTDVQDIGDLLRLLTERAPTPERVRIRDAVLAGYAEIQRAPFRAHRVAATRTVSYQYYVVMKYLDNLIAWGDNLFREDTAESLTEATQRYVLAAAILGPRPQRLPPAGRPSPKTFAQLKEQGLDALGNVRVELESQFPFDTMPGPTGGSGTAPGAPDIGRTLYFCVPRNERLLRYWDRVEDRLTKVRTCRTLEGVERQVALFEPALDPGMLARAAAAGIAPASAASAALQPVGPLRCGFLIQQALQLCQEVRSLGTAVLAAVEKGDAEELALLRQSHETTAHGLAQEVRFLQWRQAQAATDALLGSREVILERHRFQRRLLGLPPAAPELPPVPRPTRPEDPPSITEGSFDQVYAALVGRYDRPVPMQAYPELRLVGDRTPAEAAGATGSGRLNLIPREHQELNEHLPAARDLHLASSVLDTVASVVTMIPDFDVDLHFWGLGVHSTVFGGVKLSEVSKIAAGIVRTKAVWEQDQAGLASRTASYERRTDEWTLQHNVAAHELQQVGRQVLTAVLAEQAAQREYLAMRDQVRRSAEADRFLREKFTNRELYGVVQGELTRLYHEYFRLALDVARKAELAMKRELMAAELDATRYVQPSYPTEGRPALLAADTLALDLRRLEVAYREYRRREYELVRHVSVRQLDPLALLELQTTGSCEISVPESLFDLDCPGHYLRRLTQVSLSIPSVAGPYTSISCTLSLLRSSVRVSAEGADYGRAEARDDRFTDFVGTVQSIVTSSGQTDSGLFDPAGRDERFLPFEGAGAISSWRLRLPEEFRQFDYATISDVVLHLRYTAREGGSTLRDAAVAHLRELVSQAEALGTARMFSVRQEFPDAWARMKAVPRGQRAELTLEWREDDYPYWSRGRNREVRAVEVLARTAAPVSSLEVFDGPGPSAGRDTLMRDTALGGLLRGSLSDLGLPPAVGTVSLFLEDPGIEDLWLVLTWGA